MTSANAQPAPSEFRRVAPGGTPVIAFAPAGDGPFPCVIVLHERYGLGRHTIEVARTIAAAGYAVIAPDLFSAFPDKAGLENGTAQATPADAAVLELLEDAVAVFSSMANAAPAKVAVVGVCQTGRYPLVWAAHHPVDACVVLYGAAMERDWAVNERQPLGLEALIERIDTSVLAIFGEADHLISLANVVRLRDALERRNADYQITVYADAPHGWMNDTMPGRYRADIARASWAEVLAFLHARLSTNRDTSIVSGNSPRQIARTTISQKTSALTNRGHHIAMAEALVDR